MPSNTEDRAGYIAGLRQLADLLDANPDVPLPYNGRTEGIGELLWVEHGTAAENARVTAALLAALPESAIRTDGVWPDDEWYETSTVHAALAGLHVEAIIRTPLLAAEVAL